MVSSVIKESYFLLLAILSKEDFKNLTQMCFKENPDKAPRFGQQARVFKTRSIS